MLPESFKHLVELLRTVPLGAVPLFHDTHDRVQDPGDQHAVIVPIPAEMGVSFPPIQHICVEHTMVRFLERREKLTS